MMKGLFIMSDTFACMFKDIKAVLVYYPSAVIIGFGLTILFILIHKKEHWQLGKGRTVIAFLFFSYVIMVLYITYFSREPGSRIGIDLQIFGTWGQRAQSKAYFLENILLFIPFGCCFPIVWRRMRNPFFLLLTAGVISVSIELSQYITRRGYCQIDDVITNIFGAFIGCLIYWTAYFILSKVIRNG
ncbi:VanZ family protein [Lachnospiraceae bacterium 48-33]